MSEQNEAEAGADAGPATTGAPRWVKVFGLVVAGLVALVVVLQLTGVAGDHGPARHGPAQHDQDRHAPSRAVSPGVEIPQ